MVFRVVALLRVKDWPLVVRVLRRPFPVALAFVLLFAPIVRDLDSLVLVHLFALAVVLVNLVALVAKVLAKQKWRLEVRMTKAVRRP